MDTDSVGSSRPGFEADRLSPDDAVEGVPQRGDFNALNVVFSQLCFPAIFWCVLEAYSKSGCLNQSLKIT